MRDEAAIDKPVSGILGTLFVWTFSALLLVWLNGECRWRDGCG